jgi:jmjN domain
MDWPGQAKSKQDIMVFRPTMEMFSDFERCIEHMESMGAHKVGLAKVNMWFVVSSGRSEFYIEKESVLVNCNRELLYLNEEWMKTVTYLIEKSEDVTHFSGLFLISL